MEVPILELDRREESRPCELQPRAVLLDENQKEEQDRESATKSRTVGATMVLTTTIHVKRVQLRICRVMRNRQDCALMAHDSIESSVM